jgi:hypothetical protein
MAISTSARAALMGRRGIKRNIMVSRRLAFAVAAALTFSTSTAAIAQSRGGEEESSSPVYRDETAARADLWLVLGAIVGAALVAFLASQLGGGDADEPASP